MFAQPWAAFCLVSLVACNASGASNEPPASEVVVYLSADSGQSPHVVDSMKREFGQLMQTAGYDVAWRDIHDQQRPYTASPLVVVHLGGVCSMPSGGAPAAPPEKPESLG